MDEDSSAPYQFLIKVTQSKCSPVLQVHNKLTSSLNFINLNV